MPKHVWRSPSTRRTLDSITLDSLVRKALQGRSQSSPVAAVIVEADVTPDGAGLTAEPPRQSKESDWAGVFALHNVGEEVRVNLDPAACSRQVGVPRRPSQHIARLRAWEPVRVILNGKADGPSDRYYHLQDYHLVLCEGDMPGQLPPVRVFDFQADLI